MTLGTLRVLFLTLRGADGFDRAGSSPIQLDADRGFGSLPPDVFAVLSDHRTI